MGSSPAFKLPGEWQISWPGQSDNTRDATILLN